MNLIAKLVRGAVVAQVVGLTALFQSDADAFAATYNVNFMGDTPGIVDFSAVITTDGANLVTSIVGLVNVIDSITGIIPTGTSPFTGSWSWNNLFSPSNPWVDNGGILFQTAAGWVINLYTVGNDYLASFKPGTNAQYDPGVRVEVEVALVKVPTSLLLLLSALFGLGVLGRKRVMIDKLTE